MAGFIQRLLGGARPYKTPDDVARAAQALLRADPRIAAFKVHDDDRLAIDLTLAAKPGAAPFIHLNNLCRTILDPAMPGRHQKAELARGLGMTVGSLLTERPAIILANVLPQVRNIGYQPKLTETDPATWDTYGARPLAGDLVALLMEDMGESYASVTAENAKDAGLTVAALWDEAFRNLARHLDRPRIQRFKAGVIGLTLEGEPLLTLGLLLDLDRLDNVLDGLGLDQVLLSAPVRHTILLARTDQAKALADLTTDALKKDHPQSACIFSYAKKAGQLTFVVQLAED